jgi:hypothetical protein
MRLFRAIPLPGERSLVARSWRRRTAFSFQPIRLASHAQALSVLLEPSAGADELVKCRPRARGAPPRPSLDLVLRCEDELTAACFRVVVERD